MGLSLVRAGAHASEPQTTAAPPTRGLASSPYADLAAFVLGTCVVLWRVGRLQGRLTDDAFITFRYARNVADGHGWRYNLHSETANAATSSLWTAVLAAADILTGRIVGSAVVLFALCLAGTAALLLRAFRKRGTVATGVVAAVLVLTAPWIISVAGTEYGLLLLLITAALSTGVVDDRPVLAGVFAALACFTRGEAAIFLVILGIVIWVQGTRLPSRYVLGIVVAGIPAAACFRVLTGSIVPATLDAKIAQGASGFWGEGNLFVDGLTDLPRGLGFLTWWCLVVVLAVAGIALLRRPLVVLCLPVVAFAVTLAAAYSVLGVPAYHWYYTPIVYAALLLAAVAIGRVIDDLGTHSRRSGTAACVLAVVIVVGLAFAESPRPDPAREYVVAARWINAHAPPRSTVAATEIGLLGWHARRDIVDYLGLLDERSVDELSRGDLESWLERTRPDYWVVHSPAWGFEVARSTPGFASHYRRAVVLEAPSSPRTRALVVYRRIG